MAEWTERSKTKVVWRVLGGISVHVDGVPVRLTPRTRTVLARLLAACGRPVDADALLDQTAPGIDGSAVRAAVSRARRSLRPFGLDGRLETTDSGYRLRTDDDAVDHQLFTGAVMSSQVGERALALRLLDEAELLWTGAPYADVDDPCVQSHARALEETHRTATEWWGALMVQSGRADEALPRLEEACEKEPLRERRWATLMRAHYAVGNQAESLRAYDRARRALVDVGLEPGEELLRVADDIVHQVAEVQPQQHPGAATDPWPRVPGAGGEFRSDGPDGASAVVREQQLTGSWCVLGREDELADLTALLSRHRIVQVTGFAGVGKSTLAVAAANTSERETWLVHPGDLSPDELAGVIAAASDHAGGESTPRLLVLDGCDHTFGELRRSLRDAPLGDLQILTTSCVAPRLPAAVTMTVYGLALGSPCRPAAGAMLAADHARIRTSRIQDSWSTIEAICRRSGGIPLIVRDLADGVAEGFDIENVEPDSVALSVKTTLAAAGRAVEALAETLARADNPVDDADLPRFTALGPDAVRRAICDGIECGVLVRRDGVLRVLEPTRQLLADPFCGT